MLRITLISKKLASLSIIMQNDKKTPPSDGGAQRGKGGKSYKDSSFFNLRPQSGKSTVSRARLRKLKGPF